MAFNVNCGFPKRCMRFIKMTLNSDNITVRTIITVMQ